MDGGAPESFEGGGGWWTTTMLWSMVLFGSFLLNATLLFAFLKRPGLRTISNRFVMNLIASNLLTCLFLTPLLMLDAPPSSYESSLCVISEGASALVVSSSILSVLLIAIDQYFAVVDPLRYRTRIDKLKCGALIISVWIVSILVAILAAFNPQPKSMWLSCRGDYINIDRYFERNVNSTITLIGNDTDDYNVTSELKFRERNNGSTTIIEEDIELIENSTTFVERTIIESSDDPQMTMMNVISTTNDDEFGITSYLSYGFAYATFYTIFVYLLPFVGVCWIYVSIYLAAHKNSERARRTGSGPMLSSPSFCEEYGNVRQDFSNEDFRRIPKISSLSSIDESIETSPSHIPRGRSEMMLCSSPIEEEEQSTSSNCGGAGAMGGGGNAAGVVFTVGSQKVDVSPQKPNTYNNYHKIHMSIAKDNDNDYSKVPISALKAEFLNKHDSQCNVSDDHITRSKFHDRPDDRRKSSHDILCENIMRNDLTQQLKIQDDDDNSSSDSSAADEEEMLTFAKNYRIEDIEVAKCQNSIQHPLKIDDISLDEFKNNFSSSTSYSSSAVAVAANEPNNFNNQLTQSSELFKKNSEVKNHVEDVDDKTSKLIDQVQSSCSNNSSSSNSNSNSNKMNNSSGILSRAALENHNAKSRFQNSRSMMMMNGRYLNNSYNNNRTDITTQDQQPELEIFNKCTSGQNNYSEAESSLLGTSGSTSLTTTAPAPVVTITPPNKIIPLHRVSSIKSTSSYINSLKYRISNGSLFKYREETRAARISALVIVMGLICWTPYVVVLIIRNLPKNFIQFNYDYISHRYDVMALSFLILAAYVSPLLFGYRSRRVKRELRKIFCFKKELSYKNNRSLMAKKVLKRRHSSNLSQIEMESKYSILGCVYGRNRWPKDKVQFMQVPDTALAVETCRSSFSSGASTQISTTSTEE